MPKAALEQPKYNQEVASKKPRLTKKIYLLIFFLIDSVLRVETDIVWSMDCAGFIVVFIVIHTIAV